jgi:putative endonuclease
MFCVYILFSETIQQYYCGQTANLSHRLEQHNAQETLSNKHGIPWNLVGYLELDTRAESMMLERKIKKEALKDGCKAIKEN